MSADPIKLAEALDAVNDACPSPAIREAAAFIRDSAAREAGWQPQFDACSVEQEALVRQFCDDIAGPRGQKGSPPDPVRLLEMAQALYEAERKAFAALPAAPDAVARYKVGNEFAPFHPSASHVRPDYRDGWNACYVAAMAASPKGP